MRFPIRSLEFNKNKLILIDQRKLPENYEKFVCKTYSDVKFAIKDMVIRGAPAIGVTAAYGVVLAAIEFSNLPKDKFIKEMENACVELSRSRPTAVNLMWAIKKMRKILKTEHDVKQIIDNLKVQADNMAEEDVLINKKMGQFGNSLIPPKAAILTHCNTGALATVEFGTALGVIRAAYEDGKDINVFADETRPRLQGARLTAWELMQENIPAKLVADSTAATLIRDGKIDLILVGADRIAANGDTANKIGTFMLSVIANKYNVPFYVVAPTSTIDNGTPEGSEIFIEERSAEEITHINGIQIAPDNIDVYNPAFDVTPNENITAIITEKGIIEKPFKENIASLSLR